MLLSALIGPQDVSFARGSANLDIAGLTADSRKVQPGYLFAALTGSKADGASFVADAVARGAVAVLVADGANLPAAVPQTIAVLRCGAPRRMLSLMAARFYQRQPRSIFAVTGTNGKTSVAEFTRQIFAVLGHQAASLGTIGLVTPQGAAYGSLTTPDPVSLHATLAELADDGITHLALEASSHGLDQQRLDGVRFTAAAFTNLGRDHLDYHPTVDAYFDAKMRLFSQLLAPGQTAVVNADGARADDVMAVAHARGLRVVTTGRSGKDLVLTSCTRDGLNQRLSVRFREREISILFPLLGAYQVENALLAAGLAVASSEDAAAAVDAIGRLSGVRGRLDIVGRRAGGLAVVDYAHKPEALAAALDALRPFASGRLICVFGCGGDRDRGKRPIMGRIAAEKADVVIVTDDNPRSEKPETIRAEILAAAAGAHEIGDRAEAIRTAVAMLGEGDVVLVAGKGHETGQIVGDKVLPFSDHEAVQAALEGSRTL
jgi:UDP-N-acetylmuramoyl-L-alanyl-D-glutamate--2,6-diaminopimelate ligase